MKQILPGIKMIFTVPVRFLPEDVAEKDMARMYIDVFAESTYVPFVGDATCESTEDYRNNGKVYKTELKFLSTERLPDNEPLAFIVTDVRDKDFLIGTREKPFPTIKVKTVFGKTDGRAGYEYEVSLHSVCGLVPCVV